VETITRLRATEDAANVSLNEKIGGRLDWLMLLCDGVTAVVTGTPHS